MAATYALAIDVLTIVGVGGDHRIDVHMKCSLGIDGVGHVDNTNVFGGVKNGKGSID